MFPEIDCVCGAACSLCTETLWVTGRAQNTGISTKLAKVETPIRIPFLIFLQASLGLGWRRELCNTGAIHNSRTVDSVSPFEYSTCDDDRSGQETAIRVLALAISSWRIQNIPTEFTLENLAQLLLATYSII